MDTEVENYKKSITKKQERNEQLTLMLNKVEHPVVLYIMHEMSVIHEIFGKVIISYPHSA